MERLYGYWYPNENLPPRYWEGEPAEGDDYPVEEISPYEEEELPFT